MSTFESRIDEIINQATPHFRKLGPDAREEALQNTLALAWTFWVRLVEQGKDGDEANFLSMIWYAIKHTRMGRFPQGRGGARPKDVLDYARRHKAGVARESADLNYLIGRSALIPDAAAFRIDTPVFLNTLSSKNRGLALDLSSGMTTKEAAERNGVTPGAISQFRTRFKKWYDEFHGEV